MSAGVLTFPGCGFVGVPTSLPRWGSVGLDHRWSVVEQLALASDVETP